MQKIKNENFCKKFKKTLKNQVFLLIGTKSEHWVKTDTE